MVFGNVHRRRVRGGSGSGFGSEDERVNLEARYFRVEIWSVNERMGGERCVNWQSCGMVNEFDRRGGFSMLVAMQLHIRM